MLKLIIVCVTIVLVVRILSKKEKVADIHKGKIVYDKKAVIDEREKARMEAINKEKRERTCPKCNKYNYNNFDQQETLKGGVAYPRYDYFECKECGATWKIERGV